MICIDPVSLFVSGMKLMSTTSLWTLALKTKMHLVTSNVEDSVDMSSVPKQQETGNN